MALPGSQAATGALLASIAGVDRPLETHISAVFVGAGTTLKLRKAVRLSFVDFTTLAAREQASRREVELGSPHAPGFYRGVRPVVRGGDGTLRLGDETGDIVDWVVEMASVPGEDFLDAVAARGGLDGMLLDAIADRVSELHRTLPAARWTQADRLREVIAGNAASARDAAIPPETVSDWERAAVAALASCAPWLEARAAEGRVRRAHGDLHLGNMLMWHGAPVPFDPLEFDEALATIDVAYDLAFLLMDVEHRAGRAAANRVMNRYIARTGDVGLVAGLPLFLSLRAMVRAHVEAARGRAADSAAYLSRALAYLQPAAACAAAIGGLPGSGKSTLARRIAPALGPAPGAVVLRSDEIRKRLFGAAPETRLPADAYRESVSRAVLAALARDLGRVVAHGHAAIADATFMDPADRDAIAAAARGVPFVGVWLSAPVEMLEARIAARRGDASDATVAVLRRAAAHDPGPGTWRAVDATDPEGAAAAVLAALRHTGTVC